MLIVVAGIIRRADGEILICKRGAGKRPETSLRWEFPGGKLEEASEETPEAALERELREELNLSVRVGRVADAIRSGGALLLFFECTPENEPECLEHEKIAWVDWAKISKYDLLPADRMMLERAQRRV